MTTMQDKDLDQLLGLAARQAMPPSPGLMDRVLADALALQPQPSVPVPARPGLLHRLSALFGGGPALAGVCTAAVAGLALGYLSPATLEVLTGTMTGAEVVDLFPSTDFLTVEG
jgi:hypothetical protein